MSVHYYITEGSSKIVMFEIWFLLGKLLVLYLGTFSFSLSVFLFVNRTVLPPHLILKYPLQWQAGGKLAIIDLDRGQRLGGNFYLKRSNSSFDDGTEYFKGEEGGSIGVDKRASSSSSTSTSTSSLFNSNVQQKPHLLLPEIPYDIALVLTYPDRPEISDLGNLRVQMRMMRDGGQEMAGQIEALRALRYESPLLRLARQVISLPGALWRDEGSQRTERISVIERLVLQNDNNRGKDKNLSIDRLEISVSPLPALHSVHLEILANLTALQLFLFKFKLVAAVIVIGGLTGVLWTLVTIYALIEAVRMAIRIYNSRKIALIQDKEEEEELSSVNDELIINDFDNDDNDDNGDNDVVDENEEIVSINFPPAESVASFIGDLRQRKPSERPSSSNNNNTNDDDDDLIEEIESLSSCNNDQSVPNVTKTFKED